MVRVTSKLARSALLPPGGLTLLLPTAMMPPPPTRAPALGVYTNTTSLRATDAGILEIVLETIREAFSGESWLKVKVIQPVPGESQVPELPGVNSCHV